MIKTFTYEEFIQEIVNAMSQYVGDEEHVRVQEVKKNNGIVLNGISVFSSKRNVSPTIYLEEFYEQYRKGSSFGEVMQTLIKYYEAHICRQNLDLSFFADYEKTRKKIAYKLVNREKNSALLEEVPHITYLNLAIVFYCAVENEWIGSGTILIRNSHLKMWNTTQEILYEDAIRNTPKQYPVRIYTMSELLCDMVNDRVKENRMFPGTEETDRIPMRVLTNEQKLYGASVMLYDGVLQKLATQFDSNLVILPSSVHEVITLPVADAEEACSMERMVREVNRTQVAEEEILSDQVYFYERKTGKLVIAQNAL